MERVGCTHTTASGEVAAHGARGAGIAGVCRLCESCDHATSGLDTEVRHGALGEDCGGDGHRRYRASPNVRPGRVRVARVCAASYRCARLLLRGDVGDGSGGEPSPPPPFAACTP